MSQRGFTINELMVTLATMLVMMGTVGGIGMSMHQRNRTTAAYAEDLSGLRRAARHLQEDLRGASSLTDVAYRLEDGALLRGDRSILRNVASFALTAEDGLARVRIQLAPRSDAPTRREAVLDFRVRMRGPREGPR